jgi:thermostable 8-oxoguanine DNA glycosylase
MNYCGGMVKFEQLNYFGTMETGKKKVIQKSVTRYTTEEEAIQDKLKKMNELLSKTDLSLFYKNTKRA